MVAMSRWVWFVGLLFSVGCHADDYPTLWHAPIPQDGPRVGCIVPDISSNATPDHLYVMGTFSMPARFALAGYRPSILLPPRMATDARIQRALKLTEYEPIAATLDDRLNLQDFDLLFTWGPRWTRPVPGLLKRLDEYVKAGGHLIYIGGNWNPDPELNDFLGIANCVRSEIPFNIAWTTNHPVVEGLSSPLLPVQRKASIVYHGSSYCGRVILTYGDGATPLLRTWANGKGRVAHFNTDCESTTSLYAMALNKEGLLFSDLVLRVAELFTQPKSMPRPYPATRKLIRLLRATDILKPSDRDAVFFSASFDKSSDLAAWTIWDAPKPDSDEKKSEWWIDTNMRALTQSSNIYVINGTGTRASVGSAQWRNYVVSSTIAAFDDDTYGITFRIQNPDNFYYLRVDADTVVRVQLGKCKNGRLQTLASFEKPYLLCLPFRYQVAVKDNTFTAYVNGRELIRATDDEFKTGGAGIEDTGVDYLAIYDFDVFKL